MKHIYKLASSARALLALLLILCTTTAKAEENYIIYDGVTYPVVKTRFKDEGNGNFKAFFYFSDDGKDFVSVWGNVNLHVRNNQFPFSTYLGRDEVDASHTDSSVFYWEVFLNKGGVTKIAADGNPNTQTPLFKTDYYMIIDGDPRTEQCGFYIPVVTYNSYLYGEGIDHTLALQWKKEYNAPTVSTNIVRAKTGDTKTKVSWRRATDDDTPAEKLYYEIMWKKTNEVGWHWFKGYDMTEYTIPSLTPNTKYDCQVQVTDYSGNTYKYQSIQFTTRATEEYIKISEIPVTSSNYLDISAAGGFSSIKSGTVTYDPDSKTLTLNNANIDDNTGAPLENSNIDGLNIVLKGTNAITSSGYVGIYKPTTFDGSGTGKLTITSTANHALHTESTSLDIKKCEMTLAGQHGGIQGLRGDSEKVSVTDAKLTAISKDGASPCISYINSLTLSGCYYVSPHGASFFSSKHAVCNGEGEYVTSELIIGQEKGYGLFIGEKAVTSDNCETINAENGFTAVNAGRVIYDPTAKILYLTDANINNGTDYGIRIQDNDINIYAFGTNNVSGIISSQALTILGKIANATLNSQNPSDCGIYTTGSSLTIRNCKGTISGKWGIAGNTGHYPDVTIDNSPLKISSTDGTIVDVNSLTLTGCKIVSPVNVKFFSDKHALCGIKFKDIVTGDVEIATTTAIEGVEADAATPAAVFSADGQRRATMQKGVNIVRMSDGTTRKVTVR